MRERCCSSLITSLAGMVLWLAGAAMAEDGSSVVLPATPDAMTLLEFDVGPRTNNRFQIDPASLSVAERREVRYTIVIASPAGGRTVRYESIDCSTREYLIHAVERSDGNWAPARRVLRRPIEGVGVNPYHAVLFEDYFCMDGWARGVPEHLRKRLQAGAQDNSFGNR